MINARKQRLPTIALIIALCWSNATFSQIDETNNAMTWLSFSLNKRINPNWSVSYAQLNSIAMDEMKLNFIQSNFKVSRKLAKYFYWNVGYKPTFRLNTTREGQQKVFHRLYTELQYTQKAGALRFQHKLGGEHNFTPITKFQQRYYYNLKIYYKNNDLPWKLRPYLTQKLLYYSGGNAIPVEVFEDGEVEAVSTNGLHAYRATIGLRVSPTDRLNISLYYMRQFEFNATAFGGEPLNVMNVETGRIAAPFYNFGVIGISTSFKF